MTNSIGLNIFSLSSIRSYLPNVPKASKLAVLFLSMPFSGFANASRDSLDSREGTPLSSPLTLISSVDQAICPIVQGLEVDSSLLEEMDTLNLELDNSKKLIKGLRVELKLLKDKVKEERRYYDSKILETESLIEDNSKKMAYLKVVVTLTALAAIWAHYDKDQMIECLKAEKARIEE